jgi:membrane associated rhomboid family serine protease
MPFLAAVAYNGGSSVVLAVRHLPPFVFHFLDCPTMGLYDRDYERERSYDDRPGFHLGGPTSMTTKLVVFMFVVYIVQLLTESSGNWFTESLSLYPNVIIRPWQAYQLLTYGFLHDEGNFKHIIFNMIGLWIFGRMVEDRYDSREFLAFFMVAVVFAGLVWVLGELIANQGFAPGPAMLGASGGIAAVLILFALNYPHQTVLFMFIIPMKMWVLAVILVVSDALGVFGGSKGTAFTAHLGGAAFGYLYYRWGGRIETRLPSGNFWKRLKPGPKLRVHDPEQLDADAQRLDEILKKIQDHGQESLTRSERRFMEKTSREYQKRRK